MSANDLSTGPSKAIHGVRDLSTTPLVFIIDDDELMRLSLESLFRSVELEARSYGSSAAFVQAKLPDRPGCLVLDVRLPGHSGLEFQADLARMGVQLPVILITGHGDIPMSVRAMKAGAVDFLTKPFREQDMLDAVFSALERDRARRAEEALLETARRNFQTLTLRERQIMAHVTAGLMNKQIAAELDLSEITVKVYRGSAMRKMGAGSLAELVRLAQALESRP